MPSIEHPLLVLTPRPWKWLGVLMASLVLGFGGWLTITDPDNDARQGIGWSCLVFFGLCAVAAIIQLIPGSSRVVVTSIGLYQTAMFRRSFHAWDRIERFGVSEWTQWHGPFRQRHRQIGIRFKAGSKVRKRWRSAAVRSTGGLPRFTVRQLWIQTPGTR